MVQGHLHGTQGRELIVFLIEDTNWCIYIFRFIYEFFSPKPTYRKSVHTFLCFLLPLPDSLLSLKSTCYVERRACSRQHYILRNDCNMISQRYFNEGRWPKFRHRELSTEPAIFKPGTASWICITWHVCLFPHDQLSFSSRVQVTNCNFQFYCVSFASRFSGSRETWIQVNQTKYRCISNTLHRTELPAQTLLWLVTQSSLHDKKILRDKRKYICMRIHRAQDCCGYYATPKS